MFCIKDVAPDLRKTRSAVGLHHEYPIEEQAVNAALSKVFSGLGRDARAAGRPQLGPSLHAIRSRPVTEPITDWKALLGVNSWRLRHW